MQKNVILKEDIMNELKRITLSRTSNSSPIRIAITNMSCWYEVGDGAPITRIEMVGGTTHSVKKSLIEIDRKINEVTCK